MGTQYQGHSDQPNAAAASLPKKHSETEADRPIHEALENLLLTKHPDRKLVVRLATEGAKLGAQPSDVAEWIDTFSGRRGIGFGVIVKALPEELPDFLAEKSKPKPPEPEYREMVEPPPPPPPPQVTCELCGDLGTVDLQPNTTTSRIRWCDCKLGAAKKEAEPSFVDDFNRDQAEFEERYPAKGAA